MRVAVRLRYEDLEWNDVAELVRKDGRWVMHDLQWRESGLRERLTDFLTVPCSMDDGEPG